MLVNAQADALGKSRARGTAELGARFQSRRSAPATNNTTTSANAGLLMDAGERTRPEPSPQALSAFSRSMKNPGSFYSQNSQEPIMDNWQKCSFYRNRNKKVLFKETVTFDMDNVINLFAIFVAFIALFIG